MGKRTDTGFYYCDEGFITFEDAVEELTDSYVEADSEEDEPYFTREEHREFAQFIIDNCEDGAYL